MLSMQMLVVMHQNDREKLICLISGAFKVFSFISVKAAQQCDNQKKVLFTPTSSPSVTFISIRSVKWCYAMKTRGGRISCSALI